MTQVKLTGMSFEEQIMEAIEGRKTMIQNNSINSIEWDLLEVIKIVLNKFDFETSTNRLNKSIYFEDKYNFGFSGSIYVSGETYKLVCPHYLEAEFVLSEGVDIIIHRNLYLPLMEAKEGLAQGLTMALTENLYGGRIAKYHIIKDYKPGIDISILKDLITIIDTDSNFTASLRLGSIGDYNFKTLVKCYEWVKSTVAIIRD